MKVAEYLSNFQENFFLQSFHDANFGDMTHFLTLQLQHLNFKKILYIFRLPILKFSKLNYSIWQTFFVTNIKIRDIKVSVTPKNFSWKCFCLQYFRTSLESDFFFQFPPPSLQNLFQNLLFDCEQSSRSPRNYFLCCPTFGYYDFSLIKILWL